MLLIVPLTTIVGCTPNRPGTTAPTIYTGPTDPLDVVLARINANNGRIATLNGSGTFNGSIVENNKRQELNGQINILHTKPSLMFLRLHKDIAGEILNAGVNEQAYWLSIKQDISTTWHGTPLGPGQQNSRLPFSPEMIADVLGVATLNLDLLAQPIPTMRFNPSYDAYMLTWHMPLKDRWITIREVWYDRETMEPRYIWLYDRNGRMMLRAKLSSFQPLDGNEPNAPRTARSFDLIFPESGATLNFHLDDLRARRGGRPNERTYRFDPQQTGTSRVENLDEPTR